MSSHNVTLRFAQRRDYQFDVAFGEGVPPLLCDEPLPLGQSAGPAPVQLLAAAVGNCLADSLLFALRKYKQQPEPIRGEITAEVDRNSAGRLRVLQLQATLTLGVAADRLEHLDRALAQFEDFCTVTQSIAPAIAVTVQVFDARGAQLK